MRQIKIFGLLITVFAPALSWAQMPSDAIYMNKKQICIAAMYGRSAWNQYWEHTLKRENLNIGTHITQSVMVMPAIGISNRVNVILGLPYVWTRTTAGNLMGQKGLQDVSGWLKVNAFRTGGFSVHGLVGGSIPVSRYVPDFLPMSIGLQAKTLTGRLLLNYRHSASGLYATALGSYGWRSRITVDRDSYWANDKLYNTHQVAVPNTYDASVRLGFLKGMWQTEVFAERSACTTGDFIRRNDMPFPTNNMQATTVGWYGKLETNPWGLNARISRVLDGQNVGQSTAFMVGVLYQFTLN